MEYIAFILVLVLVFVLFARSTHSTLRRETARQLIVDRRKDLIIEYLKHHGKVTNDDVQGLFDVSDSTATHYLDQLEAAGRIRQVGEHGRGVYYVFEQ